MAFSPWCLSDGRDWQVEVLEETGLEKQLRDVNARRSDNPILCLSHSVIDGNNAKIDHFMYIGLAKTVGYLNYCPTGDLPPFFISFNNGSKLDDMRTVGFSFATSRSEIPIRFCLPIEQIYQGACEYLRTGSIPKKVLWREE